MMTPEHIALQDSVRRLIDREIEPFVEKWEADEIFPAHEVFKKLGSAGYLGVNKPVEFGGMGLDYSYEIAFCEAIGGISAGGVGMAIAVQTDMATPALARFGSDELRDTFLKPTVAGDFVVCLGVSEAGAGSDVASIAARARRRGDEYVLDGEKAWISNAGIAGLYVAFARTSDDGARGLSAFVLDAAAPGISTRSIETISPHPLGSLQLDGVRVPAENRIGDEGRGFAIAMATLDVFRTTVAAAAVGFARRALAESIEHVKTRQLFGAPLSALQLTQAAIAEMALDVDAGALLAYRAAWVKDAGADRVTREAAMAKWFATEAAGRVCDRAVQLFGGRGVTRGETVERLYRDVRALRIYEGASEIQQLIVARQTLEGQK